MLYVFGSFTMIIDSKKKRSSFWENFFHLTRAKDGTEQFTAFVQSLPSDVCTHGKGELVSRDLGHFHCTTTPQPLNHYSDIKTLVKIMGRATQLVLSTV